MNAGEHYRLLAASRDAIERWTASVGDPYRIDHRHQVTSFGGSGTTALTAHLVAAGADLPKGPAQWPHKHLRVPPAPDAVPDGFRAVYVIGDPRNAVLSVFRRGIQHGHWDALHGRPPSTFVAGVLANLPLALAGPTDPFDLKGHVEAWRDHPPGYPVLFVRHEHLADGWPDIRSFLDLPVTSLPFQIRRRRSDWEAEPDDVRERLEALYGDLARWIETLPAVEIR